MPITTNQIRLRSLYNSRKRSTLRRTNYRASMKTTPSVPLVVSPRGHRETIMAKAMSGVPMQVSPPSLTRTVMPLSMMYNVPYLLLKLRVIPKPKFKLNTTMLMAALELAKVYIHRDSIRSTHHLSSRLEHLGINKMLGIIISNS